MSCPDPSEIIAAIDGELSCNAVARLDEHCARCDACRSRQQHYRQLAGAIHHTAEPVPTDAAFSAELLAMLDAPEPRPGRARRVLFAVPLAATAVCVAALVLWIGRPEEAPQSEFRARGAALSDSARLGCEIYLHPDSDPSARVVLRRGARVAVGDGFSFTCRNLTPQARYFGLFGVDAVGEVHWFYPAYLDARHPPKLPLLKPELPMLDLPEGVTPEGLAVGPLTVVGLFVDKALSATDIEDHVARVGVGGLGQQLSNASIQTDLVKIVSHKKESR